jgi:hypothetical protein
MKRLIPRKSIRVFILAGFFLPVMVGVNAITQSKCLDSRPVDLTPDRDTGVDLKGALMIMISSRTVFP